MQDKAKERNWKLPKIIILFTIFLDALGIGFITPVLPYFVESFDVPKIVVTSLFATFSIFAFFSAPILGMISDRKGRRPILMLSLFSSAVGWAVFAFSHSILGLFIGRIIDGAAAGNISTAQNYLVDISKDQKDLNKNLGWIGAVFGVGFVIGPLASGILFDFDKRLPFIIVGIMALLNTILAYFFLPETNGHKSEKKISINPFAPIINGFKNKRLLPLYLAWLFFGISIALSQAILGLYVDALFSWRALTAGLVMTMIGVIIFLNQTVLTHKVWLRYFKEAKLMVYMIVPFALGFFIMTLPYKFAFIFGIIIASLAYSTLRIITNSQVLNLCHKEEQGEVMGILDSLISFS
ncbi:MAG: MFS transporter, partial [Patescibacteria group bacterium]